MSETKVMDKSLDAVNSLAELVQAMRTPAAGTVTISRGEYETLVANQEGGIPGNGAGVVVRIPPSYGDSTVLREAMLEEIATKPLRLMYQQDYFPGPPDDMGNHFATTTWEFQKSDGVRLLHPKGMPLADVLEALESFIDIVKCDIANGRETMLGEDGETEKVVDILNFSSVVYDADGIPF